MSKRERRCVVVRVAEFVKDNDPSYQRGYLLVDRDHAFFSWAKEKSHADELTFHEAALYVNLLPLIPHEKSEGDDGDGRTTYSYHLEGA